MLFFARYASICGIGRLFIVCGVIVLGERMIALIRVLMNVRMNLRSVLQALT